ncbi:MAG: hypothetical protein LBH37_04195 [Oscillospiraceae bacterium]|jgi:hypothetical protein|nr:hypothetical protein [Oscillospiraceae bacterium]
MKKGAEKSKIQIAANLLKKSFDKLMISEITDLFIEKIECLKIYVGGSKERSKKEICFSTMT